MKAYLIDPKARTIAPVTIEKTAGRSHLRGMVDAMACRVVDVIRHDELGADIWVDDEFLDRDPKTAGAFIIEGHPAPIYGRALVCGVDDATGDSTDAPVTAAQIAALCSTLEALADGAIWAAVPFTVSEA